MIRAAIAAARAMPPQRPLCLSGLALICAWAYWPTLGAMAGKWLHDPQYAHGYLVPFFSLFLLWRRRTLLSAAAPQYNWWGVLLVLAGAALHVAGAYLYFDWLDAVSLLPCLAGFCVLLGGWPALRWAWPAIAFLLFMIPLPFRVETAFGLRLQSLATLTSTYTLQALGLPALSEGNTILLPGGAIGVAEACSGLSMLTTFFALATAVALVVRRPWLDKIVILLSAAPIAIAANVARITTTALAQEWVGRDLAHHVFHDLAGWLMMPVALALLWVELRLLAFLLVEPPADAPMAVLPSPVLPAAGENRPNHAAARRRKKAPPVDPRLARPS
jgi:exosortase